MLTSWQKQPNRTLWVREEFGPVGDDFAVPDLLLNMFLSLARNKVRHVITSKDVNAEQAAALADALARADDFALALTLHLHSDPEGQILRTFIGFLRGGGFIMQQG